MGFESLHGSQDRSPRGTQSLRSFEFHGDPGDNPASAVPPVEAVAPFHRHLAALDPESPPTARAVCGTPLAEVQRLVALPGSFNPPHRAHFSLLAAAHETSHADAGAFVLSARTVDKEQVSGLWLGDRLWLMCRLAGARAAMIVTNRGLYYEQALALHTLCPRLEALAFVTGYDKIVQIFDPRYYDDRERALDLLFSRASFLVAPRGDASERDLEALLKRPENAPYVSKVRVLTVAPDLAHVSSTRARREGDLADLPALVGNFVKESGCYLTPPAPDYAARGAAIRAAAEGPA